MNKNNQFSLTLPGSWQDQTLFTYHGPLENGVQHNLIISIDTKIPKKMDITTYAYKQLESSRIELPGFVILKEGEKILANGRVGFEVVYRYRASDEVAIYQKQFFLFMETKGYCFTASFSKKTLKTIANDVDAMIESFIP